MKLKNKLLFSYFFPCTSGVVRVPKGRQKVCKTAKMFVWGALKRYFAPGAVTLAGSDVRFVDGELGTERQTGAKNRPQKVEATLAAFLAFLTWAVIRRPLSITTPRYVALGVHLMRSPRRVSAGGSFLCDPNRPKSLVNAAMVRNGRYRSALLVTPSIPGALLGWSKEMALLTLDGDINGGGGCGGADGGFSWSSISSSIKAWRSGRWLGFGWNLPSRWTANMLALSWE